MNQSSMKRFHLEIWFRLKLSRIGVDIYFVVFTLCTLKEMIIRFFSLEVEIEPWNLFRQFPSHQRLRIWWIKQNEQSELEWLIRLIQLSFIVWRWSPSSWRGKKTTKVSTFQNFDIWFQLIEFNCFGTKEKRYKKNPSFSYLNSVEFKKKKAARVNISPKVQIFNRSIVEIWIRRFKLRWSK